MGLKTTVEQVTLIGGGRYDQSGNILVDERTARTGRRKRQGCFYALVEVSGPAIERQVITQQLTDLMRQTYYGWRGSVTAGLQEAIREANALLYEENRHSLPGERWTAGATCVALRDGDLFVAQAGPAALFLRREGETARFPDLSPWLDQVPPEEMDLAPLGERSHLNASLYHSPVSEGDTFLLADTSLVHNIPPHRWPDLLSLSPAAVMIEELLRLAKARELAALAVQIGDPVARRRPAQSVPGAVPRQTAPVDPPPTEMRPAAQPPAVEEMWDERPVPEPLPIEGVEDWDQPEPGWGRTEQTVTRRLSLFWAQLSARIGKLNLFERLRSVGQVLAAALAGLVMGILALLKSLVPGRSRLAEPTPKRKTAKASRTRQRDRRQTAARSEPIQRVLIGAAIAIPVIVAIIVLITWLQRGQAQRAELDDLWQQVQSQWQQANATTDPAAARTHLAQAGISLEQFLERQPNDEEGTVLWQQIEARLEVVNKVKRISWIGELATYPEGSSLTRVVVQGNHIFVMDRHNHRVYHHKLDGERAQTLSPDTADTVLVQMGDEVGSKLVSHMVDMAWMPTGPGREKASLVILESGGTLLDFEPATGQLISLQVADSTSWVFPKFVGSHTGRFYVLDSSASNIWRFDPTLDGYSEPPTKWLQSDIDLAGIIDMTIGDSIYLLFANGTAQRFSQGAPDSFGLSDWDIPPSNPSAIFTRPPDETRWVYLADSGNRRIVQFSKDGQFERQYRLAENQVIETNDALAGTVGLFVDEIAGRAYLLSGQKLYLLLLPMSD